jgi:predicted RNA-binding protein with PUA domain
MSLPLLSQTLSSDSIVVPKQAVKNALIMKGSLDTCEAVLHITQEKVTLLEEKANKQNQLILNLNNVITNKDAVIVEKDNIIVLKDGQIKTLKKEKRAKFWSGVGLGGSVGIALMAILFVL